MSQVGFKKTQIKMSVSIVEQFNFKGKSVRTVHVQGTGDCLVAGDVWRAVGYGRKAGVQAMQKYVPERYKMRLGDACVDFEGVLGSKYTQPNTVLLKEAGLYCFLLRCGKPEAEPFMDWVCEEVLPREVRKLAEVMEEKNAQITFLNDELTESQDLVRQLEYNNTGLRGEIRAKDQEIERRREENADLRERYVEHCRDPGKDNVVIITKKHTCEHNDDHFEYPYYISRIQRRAISTKRRWLREKFPDSEEIVTIDNPNSIHRFNKLEEEEHVERYGCHFKLVDLTREDLYDMGIPAALAEP